jgi:cellulose synthase/poly-beta-1,6-N-acetylglucosamine synthase-like glycosyltransferase
VDKNLNGGSFEPMLLIVTIVFLLMYAALFFYYYYHWLLVKEYSLDKVSTLFISVVVAARNEELGIEQLIETINRQTYPSHLFEVIIVDDFSTDKTAEVIQPYLNERIKLIHPQQADALHSSKKKAIETGVKNAKGKLIVITDADCLVPPQWLEMIAGFHEKTGSVFIAAPVKFKSNGSLPGIFQSLDFLTLQGITAASVQASFHSMCNGANLAYLRNAFYEVDGFSGIDKVASGDDMLLMYKIWKKHPDKTGYLKNKNAIVETDSMQTWKQFIQQRIRWSGKAVYYNDYRVMAVLMFVYLLNCLFFVLLITAIFHPWYYPVLLFYVIGKTAIEWPFVYSVAKFYNEQKLMKYFPLFQPLHILYVVAIGLISQFVKYEWKGRRTK